MTPAEHYAEAERLLDEANHEGHADAARSAQLLAAAAVHAQLGSAAPLEIERVASVPVISEAAMRELGITRRLPRPQLGVSGEVTHMREVIRDYVDHVEDPERFAALVELLGGPDPRDERPSR